MPDKKRATRPAWLPEQWVCLTDLGSAAEPIYIEGIQIIGVQAERGRSMLILRGGDCMRMVCESAEEVVAAISHATRNLPREMPR